MNPSDWKDLKNITIVRKRPGNETFVLACTIYAVVNDRSAI